MAQVSKVSILNAVKAKLEALAYTADDPVDAGFVGEDLFTSVELFDATDIVEALGQLLNFDDRACVLVPLAEDFESDRISGGIKTEGAFELLCVMTDRNYAPGERVAMFGNADHPGLVNTAEIVTNALNGTLELSSQRVAVWPILGEGLEIADSDQKYQTRKGYRLNFRITTGTLETTLRRGQRQLR